MYAWRLGFVYGFILAQDGLEGPRMGIEEGPGWAFEGPRMGIEGGPGWALKVAQDGL